MTYHITIGNGVERVEDEETGVQMFVDEISRPLAPVFPNDPSTNTNTRSPANHIWEMFCEETGLTSWFFKPDGSERSGNPGYLVITRLEIDTVEDALRRYEPTVNVGPGFNPSAEYSGPILYNGNLARLRWLLWWMQWAYGTCQNPVIVVK